MALPRVTPPVARGFTLVEMLVAMLVLSILGLMSWRGLDGMVRAQETNQARSADLIALQNGLAQWGTDLDAIPFGIRHSLAWNGSVARLCRTASEGGVSGLRVVAWGLRETKGGPQWTRWQSVMLHTTEEIEQAWAAAEAWGQGQNADTAGRATAITPATEWKLLYYRANTWNEGPWVTAADDKGPDAVRLQLNVAPGRAVSGRITRDWLRPTLAGNKS